MVLKFSVLSYGTKLPINQVAGITVEDAKTIRVTPWDKNQIKEIENALNTADLGVSVVVDDQGLRVIFAELTSERRNSLIKVAKSKLEEAKISLRNARDEVWNEIQENFNTIKNSRRCPAGSDRCQLPRKPIFYFLNSVFK